MSEEQKENTNSIEISQKLNTSMYASITAAAASVISLIIIVLVLFGKISLPFSGPQGGPPPAQQAQDQKGKVVISKQYDRGRNLEKALATKKPMLVFFYTDWCGFCQRFAPTFDAVTKDSSIKKNLAIAYVNCEKEENSKYMEEYKVQGFPTVFVVKPDGTKIQLENQDFFNPDSKEVLVNKIKEIIK